MSNELNFPIKVSTLSERFGFVWRGTDVEITNVRPYSDLRNGALCFTSDVSNPQNSSLDVVVVSLPEFDCKAGAAIEAKNPRLVFAQLLNYLDNNIGFKVSTEPPKIAENAVISPSAFVGRGVKIGPRTVIGHNVVIADGVVIGADCIVKSNSVIGEAGFGFVRDDTGVPLRMSHLGTVVIGDRVEIGSLNTVCRATLGETIIENDVKIDDHVHIAHNCIIRSGALITACAELSGGVIVGRNVWIGPNSSIIEKIEIGDNAFVGIGSNVTKPVLPDSTVAGNPARILKK
ncbi:UDP-3-O-(3-hydroxymyristoyl)glucosamine N-acyltransferase [Paucibacter sp. TC2R-5]|uniref:DapH/DapD/GlmU-related protein n=1 Tax=Paucibacter sp. TC2R-5 TaxID=2893555 RepID=UPI0021E4C38F|nr:UDP-3-O-(3-hydroxymyristoyl)glucosamine N-acyltransferase [Paucibacter sp. TC2R-5]MCV2361798.1 UDP-3-O-(3-hydroxymyristoyl)glucosamine N-acyltransferase [Paucibacter sp. TC2R-5]